MSRTASRRVLLQSSRSLIAEYAPSHRVLAGCLRPFTQSSQRRAENDSPVIPDVQPSTTPPTAPKAIDRFNYGQKPASPSLNPRASPASMSRLGNFASILDQNNMDRVNASRSAFDTRNVSFDGNLLAEETEIRPPHQLHVYASRHNCHITLWGPPKSVRMNKKKDQESFKGGAILSISAGNIGFKHSGRKHYDSAFQLASYVFARMSEAGISQDIEKLELYLRGFGAGREAVTKALLGSEGKLLRNKVIKVADTTKLKFGGSKSPNPRRL